AAASDMQAVMAIVSKKSDAELMSDLDAKARWATSTDGGNLQKLGITGFCRGGRSTWLYAAHNPSLKAAVSWYGQLTGQATELTPKAPLDLVTEMKCPVLGLYGAADQGIPVDAVRRMEEAMKAANKPAEFVIYPDAPHAFHADYRPSYREQPAKDGWTRMLAWFNKYGVA